MEVGIISFTPGGSRLCLKLVRQLEGTEIQCVGCVPARYLTPELEAAGIQAAPEGGSARWAADMFRAGRSMVFIGAAGIAVRAVAPWVRDKFKDPAVVVMDEAGRFAIPILSGHVGGANRLARCLCAVTGATAVITTATDVNDCFAVDVFAAENGLEILSRETARQVAMDLLEGKPVGFFSDFPVLGDGQKDGTWLPAGCTAAFGRRNIHVGVRPLEREDRMAGPEWAAGPDGCEVLELAPRCVFLGVGCRKGADVRVLETCVDEALERGRIHPEAVACLASIDVKQQEPAILELAAKRGWELRFFSAGELEQAEGEFESSEFVKRTVGVGNVCERAAVKASGGGRLILHKQAGSGVTVAAAVGKVQLRA